MKFGRLYQLELAGTPDWPRLRYKQLKKLIKSRLTSGVLDASSIQALTWPSKPRLASHELPAEKKADSRLGPAGGLLSRSRDTQSGQSHEITSIFQTGHFKKIIREDLQSINAFWLRQEKELLDRERATEELPYLRQQQEEQVTPRPTHPSLASWRRCRRLSSRRAVHSGLSDASVANPHINGAGARVPAVANPQLPRGAQDSKEARQALRHEPPERNGQGPPHATLCRRDARLAPLPLRR